MKQSELRIGNYVLDHNDNIIRIEKVNAQIDMSGAWPTIAFNGVYYYVSYCKPIPLTEEWLRKFGFVIEKKWESKAGSDFLQHNKEVVVSLSHHYGNHIYLNSNEHNLRYMIEYVHELQNIYYILIGEKLDIINS